MRRKSVAVVIPCYNEEVTIANVIADYSKYFSTIYVIDNNSTDNSIKLAKKAGAKVLRCPIQGKGAVLRYAFKKLNEDYLVLVDGDSTYSAFDSYRLYYYMITHSKYDEVVGNRLNSGYFNSKQKINGLGNKIFSMLASRKMGYRVRDLLSGSRVLKKSFYKTLRLNYNGFEVETEITLQSNKSYYIDISYFARPENSYSSLNCFVDGFLILLVLFRKRRKR